MKSVPLFLFSLLLLLGCKRTISDGSRAQIPKDSIVNTKLGELNALLTQRAYQRVDSVLDSLRPDIERLDNVLLNGRWRSIKASALMGMNKYDSARLVILDLMQYGKDHDSTGKVYLNAQAQYGDWLLDRDSLKSALQYLENACYTARKIDSAQLPKLCYSIFQIYMRLRDYSATRRYLQEGWLISHMPRYHSKIYATAFNSAFMAFYGEIEQLDSAMLFYEMAVRDTVNILQPYYKGVLDWNMGEILLKQKQYEQALPKFISGFTAIVKYDGPQPILYSTIASINNKLGRYPTALAYADTAVTLAHQQRKWESVTNVWKLKGQIHEKLGDYRKAYRAFDSALAGSWVLMDSTIARRAHEIQTEYKVKAKDDEIVNLAALNEANQKIAGQQRILLASLIITFALIGIIGVMWYRRRRLNTELRETALRQQLLRTQMEPHFIFNTLSVLQGYIYAKDAKKAMTYLSHFSRLLRVSLKNARQSLVSLDSEIEALQDYLSLQVMQSDRVFSYHIQVDPALEDVDVYVPPMLLQPFVENAIVHGFCDPAEVGYLSISVAKENQMLRCIIEDNGKGIERRKDGKSKEKPSFATAITVERLQILSRQSGQKAVLSISDRGEGRINAGTRVEMLIPFRLSPYKDYQTA